MVFRTLPILLNMKLTAALSCSADFEDIASLQKTCWKPYPYRTVPRSQYRSQWLSRRGRSYPSPAPSAETRDRCRKCFPLLLCNHHIKRYWTNLQDKLRPVRRNGPGAGEWQVAVRLQHRLRSCSDLHEETGIPLFQNAFTSRAAFLITSCEGYDRMGCAPISLLQVNDNESWFYVSPVVVWCHLGSIGYGALFITCNEKICAILHFLEKRAGMQLYTRRKKWGSDLGGLPQNKKQFEVKIYLPRFNRKAGMTIIIHDPDLTKVYGKSAAVFCNDKKWLMKI